MRITQLPVWALPLLFGAICWPDSPAKWQEKAPMNSDEVTLGTLGGIDTPFKVEAYLQAAKALQAMRKEKAAKTLLSLAEKDNEGKVSILCRLLFRPKKGTKFRDPGLGGMMCIGGTKTEDWPAAPLAIQEGVPFLIAIGFKFGGERGNSVKDVTHCIEICDWVDTTFGQITPQMQQEALANLMRSRKWQQPLLPSEKAFLRDQLK
jgi:hypothetical protein